MLLGPKLVISIFFTFLKTTECTEDYKSDDTPDVVFKYYNKDYPNNDLVLFVADSIRDNAVGWRNDKPVKIITHGWQGDGQSPVIQDIVHAYLEKQDYNLIGVDWSENSQVKWYPLEVKKVRIIGRIVADLINVLIKNQMVTYENLHLIGHSAGAHVMGIAGANVTGGTVGRITGLDPAKPGFQNQKRPNPNVLDTEDAVFVDIIHSNKLLGFTESLGHADFWPNGPRFVQVGCKGLTCSHGRSFEYFADSIRHPQTFKAWQCDNWKTFDNGDCMNNPTVYMGEETPTDTRGNYYLRTNEQPPFGMGDGGG